MFSHGYFTCIILFFNLYTEVPGDLKKLSCDFKQNQPERVLEKFFLDVENYLMQDCPNRHVTIIAPNSQLLRAATPIFRGRPYFVGTNSKVIVQSRDYANENCVFLFSYKIYYDYSILIYLPSDYNTKIHLVSTIDISEDEMKNIFSLASYGLMENVTIIFLQNNYFKAFKVFPYTRNRMREIRLSYIWGPDKGLKTYYYDDDSPRNLNKCSIPISTLSLKSTITIHENPDGTLDILVVTGDLRKLSSVLKRYEMEQLLQKFLVDADSHLMQNCPSRQMSIIAPNNQLLRAATPLFKGRPCFVGTSSKFMVQSREYAKKNCVFVFIDTIDYDYLSTIFSHLPSDYETKVRILSTNNLLKDEVRKVLDLAYDKSIENVTITFLENNLFKAFQFDPFTRNCKREVRISYTWAPDKGLKTYYYDDHSPRNLNNCPIPISTLSSVDFMSVHENPNGTLTVLGGPEGNLIQRFVEKLNFTAVVKYPEIRVWENVVNNTILGLVGDVANRKSLIAIGQLLPTLPRQEYSDFTKSYDDTCLVWTTPAITGSTEDVLYSEFSTYLWAAVVSSIIFSCVFIYMLSRIRSRNQERQTFIDVTIDVIRATLGTAVQRLPTSRPGRIYLISYIFYRIVAITAYQTYLASILTVRKEVQLIKTEADIIRSKLIPGGGTVFLSVLHSKREGSPSVPYLIDNFEIFAHAVAALDRIKYKKNFAFAKDRSTMKYFTRNLIISRKEVYFYTFDGCIVSYPITVLVDKGSVLTRELNDIIVRLRESGLVSWWKNENSNGEIEKARESNIEPKNLKLWQLKSIFILYLWGVVLSSFVMLLEIMFGALSKKKKSK